MGFIQSYFSDKGEHRKSNQDALAIIKAVTCSGETLLGVVCDGMGGYSQGEQASKYCINKIVEWYKGRFSEITRMSTEDDWRNGVQIELDFLIKNVNEQLVSYGRDKGIKIGSTITGIIFWKHKYLVFHAGDSRAYYISDEIRQITTDDSLAVQKIQEGKLTEEEAKKNKKRNILTECVGVSTGVSVKFYHGDYSSGDCFLLCSDGFWHNLESDELVRYLLAEQITSDKDMQMHLKYLTNLVYERGEHDNASSVGIKVQ